MDEKTSADKKLAPLDASISAVGRVDAIHPILAAHR